jgi:hypothetical protein
MTRRSQAGPAQAGALHDTEGRHSRRTPAAGPAARRGAALMVINPDIVAGIESILRPLRDLGMRPAGGHRRGSVACESRRAGP